jgi:hypothetical protein
MKRFAAAAIVAALIVGAPAGAKEAKRAHYSPGKLIVYQLKDFQGDYYEVATERTSMPTLDWNIHSIGINPGEKWQVCAKPRFREPCMVLSDSVTDASTVGIMGGIGSARPAPAGQ